MWPQRSLVLWEKDCFDIPEIYYGYGRYRRKDRQLFKAYVSGNLSVRSWNLRTEFLLMKELEADFRIITSTQESVRKEKLTGRFTGGKLVIGICCCSYAIVQYGKIYNHESVYLLGLFFAGTYLILRSGMALILSYIRNKQERNYYRHLLQRNKLYYRSKTVVRYGVLFLY